MKRIIITIMLSVFPVHTWAAQCGNLTNPILILPGTILFNPYHPADNTDLTGNGGITITCTVTIASTLPDFTIALSAGNGTNFSPRKLVFLTGALEYNIYTSAGYGSVWGDGTNGTVTQSYNHNDGLASKVFTAFGKITKHQYPLPGGPYLDTMTATITY